MIAAAEARGEDRLFRELSRALESRAARRIPPDRVGGHAAVALLLAGPSLSGDLGPVLEAEDGEPPEADELTLRAAWRPFHALLILRTRIEGDPWAGHVALPGGKREAADRSLVDTARRETREETGLVVRREDVLGRLADLHPRGAHLPDLAIRPFVARWRGTGELALNHEVEQAFWVPLGVLSDPRRRSELVLDRPRGRRRFPTIEVDGHTVWGLTHAILQDFFSVLPDVP